MSVDGEHVSDSAPGQGNGERTDTIPLTGGGRAYGCEGGESGHKVQLSKFLALVLRHAPGRVGITLDENGWADVGELIAACAAAGHPFSRDELEHVVATNSKRRFAFSKDGRRIRANQGHSVDVDLRLAAAMPPDLLFHGTAASTVPVILREGLRPMSRQDVHLSSDIRTATRVGARHGQPAVLAVDAAGLVAEGHVFRVSANGVWLTTHVPAAYLRLRT